MTGGWSKVIGAPFKYTEIGVASSAMAGIFIETPKISTNTVIIDISFFMGENLLTAILYIRLPEMSNEFFVNISVVIRRCGFDDDYVAHIAVVFLYDRPVPRR